MSERGILSSEPSLSLSSRLRNFRKIVTRSVDNEEGDLKSYSESKSMFPSFL